MTTVSATITLSETEFQAFYDGLVSAMVNDADEQTARAIYSALVQIKNQTGASSTKLKIEPPRCHECGLTRVEVFQLAADNLVDGAMVPDPFCCETIL